MNSYANQGLNIMMRLRRITPSILDFAEMISRLLYHNNAPTELKKCQRHEVMVATQNQALSKFRRNGVILSFRFDETRDYWGNCAIGNHFIGMVQTQEAKRELPYYTTAEEMINE
jgi:hypothetical protein